MHVVVVGHRRDAVLALGAEQDLVGDGPAERGYPAAGEVFERAESVAVGVANAQHLAELVVGDGDRHRRAAGRRVLDAAQPDLGVAARHRLVDGGVLDDHELRRPPESARDQLRDLDVEPDHRLGVARARLDERRSSFGVAGPAERTLLLIVLTRGQSRRQDGQQPSDEDSQRHHPQRLIADRGQNCSPTSWATRILSE